MDIGIFTGRFPKVEFIEDRPGHYERLVAEGKLEAFKAKHPSILTYLWGQLFGFGTIFVGVITLLLILWAFLR
jgi:hypothetical protein